MSWKHLPRFGSGLNSLARRATSLSAPATAGWQVRGFAGAPGSQVVSSYARSISLYHWSMAAGILSCFGLIEVYKRMDRKNPMKWQLLGYHKSIGLIMMALIALRVTRRFVLVNKAADLPNQALPVPAALHHLSALSHYCLYGMALAMPVSGIVMSLAGGYGLSFFGLFKVPGMKPANKAVAGTAHSVHKYVGNTMEFLVAGHIGAAFFHHFQGHGIFSRINPFAAGAVGGGLVEMMDMMEQGPQELMYMLEEEEMSTEGSSGKWTDDM